MNGEPGSTVPTAEALLCAIVHGVGEPLAISAEALGRAVPSRFQCSVFWDEAKRVWWVVPAPTHGAGRDSGHPEEIETWADGPPALTVGRSAEDAGSPSSANDPIESSSTSAPGSSVGGSALIYRSETPGPSARSGANFWEL